MNVAEERHGQTLVFVVDGRLDAHTAPALETQVLARIAAGNTAVAFDLTRLAYVSSAGLRVFLTAARRVQEAGRRLMVYGANAAVAEVFRISGFDTVLTLVPDLPSALAALA